MEIEDCYLNHFHLWPLFKNATYGGLSILHGLLIEG
jgi:hypothetical protein